MNLPIGLLLEQNYFNSIDYSKWIKWLCSLHPIWESRYLSSTTNEISNYVFMSDENRKLLRPVYWMGNWQFACLGYFQLPNGTKNRCMRAEPYPDFVQKKIDQIEAKVKATLPPAFIPRKWHLNTLLINYYGSSIDPETGKKIDQARLGEHKDHEPGPVASLSFGAKTLFQFVSSSHKQANSQVIYQQWLEDNSLLVFSGEKFKNKLFHRVQRVDRKSPIAFNCTHLKNYEVRRINLTFRYVPEEFYVDYKDMPQELKLEIDPYIDELAKNTNFFSKLK